MQLNGYLFMGKINKCPKSIIFGNIFIKFFMEKKKTNFFNYFLNFSLKWY